MQRNVISKAWSIVAIAILLAAMVFRVSWASEIAQHDSAPTVDPAIVAIEHGHYHAPLLDHMHDDSSGISDDEHPFIHMVHAFDHQVFLINLPERSEFDSQSIFPSFSINPLTPHPSGLYRPPRV